MNTPQRIIIVNRAALAPVDGWIHIVPKGELPNAEAGIVQVLDDPSLDAILANIARDKNLLGANWPGLYAGREHFIYDADKDSEALAWFKEFEKRETGIWAKDDGLTDIGAEALKNRRYKFTSFVADPGDLERVAESAHSADATPLPRYRVLRIETVGFTNQANGKELLTPIANRSGDGGGRELQDLETRGQAASAPKIFFGSGEPGNHNQNRATSPTLQKGTTMKSVCTLLGLSAEADEPAVHAAVAKLLNRGDIAPAALAALRAEQQSLAEQNRLLLGEQSETLLDGCGVTDERIRNRLRDGMKLLKNRQERLGYLADFGYRPGDPAKAATGRVLNRGTGAARESTATVSGEGEHAIAIKIQSRASELQGKGLKYDTAWNQARREVLGKN